MIFGEDSNVRSRLTVQMREALQEARKGPLRRVHDMREGKPQWPAPASTLAALVRHEMVTYRQRRNAKSWLVDEWEITEAGREALKPAPPKPQADTPRFLAPSSSGNYTSDAKRAIDVDDGLALDVIPREDLEKFAAAAREKHAARLAKDAQALDVETLERRLARARSQARQRRVDVTRHERVIEQRVAEMERQAGLRPRAA